MMKSRVLSSGRLSTVRQSTFAWIQAVQPPCSVPPCDNLGHQLATVCNGQVINHAVIQGVFGQRFQVTGLTAAEARAIAMKFARVTR